VRRTLSALIALAASVAVIGPGVSNAAELVYVFEPGCPYCKVWDKKVGGIYPRSPEGQRAPLKPVDKQDLEQLALTFERPVRYTPTFILVEDRMEVGRIEGFPGEDFFWGLLGRLLEGLDAKAGGSQQTSASCSTGSERTAKLLNKSLPPAESDSPSPASC
jgi:hypothetical protein